MVANLFYTARLSSTFGNNKNKMSNRDSLSVREFTHRDPTFLIILTWLLPLWIFVTLFLSSQMWRGVHFDAPTISLIIWLVLHSWILVKALHRFRTSWRLLLILPLAFNIMALIGSTGLM